MGFVCFLIIFHTNPEVFPSVDCQEKLPGRILFVGHGASCLGIAGAFGREDYVASDATAGAGKSFAIPECCNCPTMIGIFSDDQNIVSICCWFGNCWRSSKLRCVPTGATCTRSATPV